MRTRIAWVTGALALAVLAGAAAASPDPDDVTKHPGYVDFGMMNLFGKEEANVEIYLEQNLINLVRALVQSSDPDFAEMLSKLKQIRVQTFGIEPDKLEAIERKTEEVSKRLESQGWAPLLRARDRKEGSQTYVYMKWKENKVQGMVVMSVDAQDEASFINIVGEIDPKQLEKLQRKFDIHGLDSLDVRVRGRGKDSAEDKKER